jgi:hypothetical protein
VQNEMYRRVCPSDVGSAPTGVERRYSPTSKIASGVHRCTACQFVKDYKTMMKGRKIWEGITLKIHLVM